MVMQHNAMPNKTRMPAGISLTISVCNAKQEFICFLIVYAERALSCVYIECLSVHA